MGESLSSDKASKFTFQLVGPFYILHIIGSNHDIVINIEEINKKNRQWWHEKYIIIKYSQSCCLYPHIISNQILCTVYHIAIDIFSSKHKLKPFCYTTMMFRYHVVDILCILCCSKVIKIYIMKKKISNHWKKVR